MANYSKWDIDKWFQYSYMPTKRIIFVGSHSAETADGEESGTDCEMSEFFIKAMLHLNSTSNKPIMIHMNNLGGDWYHGMAMYDAIRASKAHVYGICWGYAMSMGSIIIQACDSRIVTRHCTFMIHESSDTLSGTTKKVQSWAKHNTDLQKRMYQIYHQRMRAAKPRITLKKIEELCASDTIYNAQEAVDCGLADWVLETLNDPYEFCATNEPNAKWKDGMKLGKRESSHSEDEN